ncbi:MAG: serine/threonine protein kinase, partial [Deltaproteobacteria bacterium]|nr:serine/threonine protein kinase [Deltaproteobacteria bacterium]
MSGAMLDDGYGPRGSGTGADLGGGALSSWLRWNHSDVGYWTVEVLSGGGVDGAHETRASKSASITAPNVTGAQVDPTPPTDEFLNQRYRVVRQLGEGGMASVYEVVDEVLRVPRAIKVMSPALAKVEKLRVRFLTEARTMARLRHPHIVSVYDVALDGDRPFIVMDLLSGGSLIDQLEASPTGLPPAAACRYIIGMLRGLQCAHAAGVIHRDIKPHNVLLAADGTPQLTDFGIAHNEGASHNLTRTSAIMGTLAYMPPEQRASAKRADARADLYASGASLFVLLTGEEPFDLYATEFHDRLFKAIPRELADVIKRACRYKPDERYASADDMADAIEQAARALDLDMSGPPLALRSNSGGSSPEALAAQERAGGPARGVAAGSTLFEGDLAASGGGTLVVDATDVEFPSTPSAA